MKYFETPENGLKQFAKTYNRTEEGLREDVEKIRKWLHTQPHLPEIMDEKMVTNFLTLNKCSVERTKQKIDMYYTIRSLMPDLYSNINPKLDNLQKCMDVAYWIPLPKLTKEMYRVRIFKLKGDCSKLELMEVVKIAFNVLELSLKEDLMFGDICIFDCAGMTFEAILKVPPVSVSKSMAVYEKIFSLPLKGLYFVNSPNFITRITSLLRAVLKPKIFDRVHIHKDATILNETFPKEILPKDFGGEEKSLQELSAMLKQKFVEYRDRFDALDEMRVDEQLRPKKLKNDEVLGFHGNFKKLDID